MADQTLSHPTGVDTPPTTTTTTDSPAWLPGADGSFRSGHADALPDDLKPYAPTLANYGSFGDVIKDLHVLKSKGDTGIKVPGEGSDPATIAAFRQAIGAGASLEDYGLKEDAKAIGEWAIAHNVPKSAVAKLMEMRAAEANASKNKGEEAEMARKIAIQTELSKMWGSSIESEAQKAESVAAVFGITPQDIVASPSAVKLAEAFNKLHKYFSESESMKAGLGTPGAANESSNPAAIIQQVKAGTHPNSAKWRAGDPETVKWMNGLYRAKFASKS